MATTAAIHSHHQKKNKYCNIRKWWPINEEEVVKDSDDELSFKFIMSHYILYVPLPLSLMESISNRLLINCLMVVNNP